VLPAAPAVAFTVAQAPSPVNAVAGSAGTPAGMPYSLGEMSRGIGLEALNYVTHELRSPSHWLTALLW